MALNYEITGVRLTEADDGSHMHVDLVGYESSHTPGEPIMIPIWRVQQKMAFGEKFHVTVDGEAIEVSAAKCDICGFEPYLKTAADKAGDHKLLQVPKV